MTDRERRLAAALYVAMLEIQHLQTAIYYIGRGYKKRYRRPLPQHILVKDNDETREIAT